MIYPLLVLVTALGLTALVALLAWGIGQDYPGLIPLLEDAAAPKFPEKLLVPLETVWLPPVMLAVAAALVAGVLASRRGRAWLRWRLPAFREASLAQVASSLALLLRSGMTLTDALALAAAAEGDTRAGQALTTWRREVESGHGKPSEWAALAPFPPLFLWLVRQGGEDVAAGFAKAADIFQARAGYRIELALYGALPVSVLLLGQMVLWQLVPLVQSALRLASLLTDFS
jgi:type II secretory pathway component PulF